MTKVWTGSLDLDLSAEQFMQPIFAAGGSPVVAASFGVKPGKPILFDTSTREGVADLYEAAGRAAEAGMSSFLNLTSWAEVGPTLKGSTSTPNDELHILWVDIDRSKGGVAREVNRKLIKKLTARGCAVIKSPGTGRHLWFFMRDPMDSDEFQRLNTKLKHATGADDKDNIVNFLRLPYAPSYTAKHVRADGTGREASVVDFSGEPWDNKAFESLLDSEGFSVPERASRVHRTDATPIVAEGYVRRSLKRCVRTAFTKDSGDVSSDLWQMWKECAKNDVSKGVALSLTYDHPTGSARYSDASLFDQIHKAYAAAADESALVALEGDDVSADVLSIDDADLMPWLVSDDDSWESDNLDLVDIRQLRTHEPAPDVFLEPGFIIQGYVTKLSARSGSGKSISIAAMGTAWSQGLSATEIEEDGSPLKLEKPMVVLHLDGELGPRWWAKYLAKLDTPDDLPNFKLKCFPRWGSLAKDQGAMRFWHLFNSLNPDVVIFDTVASFLNGEDENDARSAQGFDLRIIVPLKARGVTVIIADHTGWNTEARRGRGHSAKQANLDVEWGQSVDENDSNLITVTQEKDRTGTMPNRAQFRRHDNPLRIERLVHMVGKTVTSEMIATASEPKRSGRKAVPIEAKRQVIYDWVVNNPNKSRTQITKGAKVRDSDARLILDGFIADGVMKVERDGQALLHTAVMSWPESVDQAIVEEV